MKKFEYLNHTEDYHILNYSKLNEYGNKGWELVSVAVTTFQMQEYTNTYSTHNRYAYIFKREINEQLDAQLESLKNKFIELMDKEDNG